VLGSCFTKKYWIRLWDFSKISLLVGIFLLPWFIFVSAAQPGFYGLTTNSGGNLYIGTGMVIDYNNGVLAEAAMRWKVDPRNNPTDSIKINSELSASQKDSQLREKSLQIWKQRPVREVAYGFEKVKIAFGISSNTRVDSIIGLISGTTILMIIVLFKLRKSVSLLFSLITGLLAVATQAFVFQADRRFTLPMIFPTFIITVALFIGGETYLDLKQSLQRFSKSFARKVNKQMTKQKEKVQNAR